VQHNCNKSSTAMKEFRDIVNSKRYKRFVYFCTEPGLARKYGVGPTVPCSLPECRNVFYKSKGNDYDIRSLIVADESEDMDLLPQFSSLTSSVYYGGSNSRRTRRILHRANMVGWAPPITV
jgi:hypothetical protein